MNRETFSIRDIKIDYDLLHKFPADFMIKNLFFPLAEAEKTLTIVISDPDDLERIGSIENFSHKQVIALHAEPGEIERILKKSDTFGKVLKHRTETFVFRSPTEDNGEEALSIESISGEDDSVVKLLNNIIFTAVNKRASDIHLEIQNQAVLVKFRIDGILTPIMEPLDRAFHLPLITRLKVISELDIAERRIPQDGRFRMKFSHKTIDFRVSIMPGIYGENGVIRILDREMITEIVGELRLSQLGFSSDLLEKIEYFIRQPYGMFLVTGPTGSGKTTTLYAALNEIKSPEDKIITIEDPVEYQVDGVTQIPVNEKKGLTFARGLRSILRHDPDKIMVGEIRDPETAQIAIQSALTGHLVFTTVHANNVFDVLGRFIHMGVDPYSFISALNCIVAQRLVRVLCPQCREIAMLSQEERIYNRIPEDFQLDRVWQAKGCQDCAGLGYTGRTAIGEVLELSDEVREMILEKKPTSEVKKKAVSQGMIPMRLNGLRLVGSGRTSLAELNRMTAKEWL